MSQGDLEQRVKKLEQRADFCEIVLWLWLIIGVISALVALYAMEVGDGIPKE